MKQRASNATRRAAVAGLNRPVIAAPTVAPSVQGACIIREDIAMPDFCSQRGVISLNDREQCRWHVRNL